MSPELPRDLLLVDAVVSGLSVLAWYVSVRAHAAEAVVSPGWAAVGFAVVTALLVVRVYTETGRRIRRLLDSSLPARAAVLGAGFLLLLVVASAIDLTVRPQFYSVFLGPALALPVEVLVYLRG